MELLSEIKINQGGNKTVSIQLLTGDLSEIPKEHAIDILVVSAFPNDYIPLKDSLFLALQNKGVSMQALSKTREIDLTTQLGCWLSAPLTADQQDRLHFKKILCFEPYFQSTEPQTVVGNIFRCINTFAFDEDTDEIAMPVLATGYQKVPIEKMMPAILEHAVFWLQNGLPLKCIKLVLYRREQVISALPIFNKFKNSITKNVAKDAADIEGKHVFKPLISAPVTSTGPTQTIIPENPVSRSDTTGPVPAENKPADTYDLFISYSHKQTDAVKLFVQVLEEKKQGIRIFYDRNSIPPGAMWLKQISDAIQHTKAVICILTPDYSKSDVCWDEFQCAKIMELRTHKSIIKTINFVNDSNMPPLFAIYSYIDCTEADLQKLKNSANQFLSV